MTAPISSDSRPLQIAVVGAGIAGLSTAWLLARRHRVTLYEDSARLGGHANTVDTPFGPVDAGFIVYNETTYPNLTALLAHLGVATCRSDMSFAVSVDGGRFEYAGGRPGGLLAQPGNLMQPRYWRMLADILRFYREAPANLRLAESADLTLGDLLARGGYGDAFVRDHLLPMAAAIWSAPAACASRQPAAAFLRFCRNHGLLQVLGRPRWRTVIGGSRSYVTPLAMALPEVQAGTGVARIRREGGRVLVHTRDGVLRPFDHVVIAGHADQALALLDDPSPQEIDLLGAFPYRRNDAVLHRDSALMPKRRLAWSSWNAIIGRRDGTECSAVTYWMNRLQPFLRGRPDLFVTLDPWRPPAVGSVLARFVYAHPQFDKRSDRAQRELWRLQGARNTWYCGAWFGAGFHEDGLQAGLAVAEALGGLRRPWRVADESGRIHLGPGFGWSSRLGTAA